MAVRDVLVDISASRSKGMAFSIATHMKRQMRALADETPPLRMEVLKWDRTVNSPFASVIRQIDKSPVEGDAFFGLKSSKNTQFRN